MFFLFATIAGLSTVAGLECYVNHTTTEQCSTSWFPWLEPACFNRTETSPDGKKHHTYGCAGFSMRTLPVKKHGYCHYPDGHFIFGNGRLCICNTTKCNHHPHVHKHLQKRYNSPLNSNRKLPFIFTYIVLIIFS